jgi:type II restriction enzyme
MTSADPDLATTRISQEAIERRNHWISEIVKISGAFGDDSSRVEKELADEVDGDGAPALLDHLRLCGAIPESYGHDTSEEKLYSKYTDALLALAFRSLGLQALVLTERADSADVEVVASDYSFVADAKAFRLSRTAKNQKDFKIQAMDNWKHGKKYAVLVAPLYQLPNRSSQIYLQAVVRDVCILSYAHMSLLVAYAQVAGQNAAQATLLTILKSISRLNPTKDSVTYWRAVNDAMLEVGDEMAQLWQIEREASAESLAVSKEEALRFLAEERERIMRMSHDEAIKMLVRVRKLDSREQQIAKVVDSVLLELRGS